MAVLPVATGNAVVTASRSPAITFASYTSVVDDIVVFVAASGAAAALATAPTNWVLPTPTTGANPVASDSHTLVFAYHKVTSAGVSTYTATNLWNATQTGNVVGVVLRGVAPATPLDDLVSGFSSTNTATPHVFPALVGANLSTSSLVVSAVAADSAVTYTTPTGYTVQATNGTNLRNSVFTRDVRTTTGTAIAAQNITPSAGDEYAAFTAAFTIGAADPKTQTLVDAFTTKDTAKFTYVGGADVVSGQAVIPARFSGSFSNNTLDYLESTSIFDFTDSYVYCRAVAVPATASNNTYGALRVRSVINPNQVMDMLWFSSGDILYFDEWVPGQVFSTVPYSATDHAWWRIGCSGTDTLYWDTAPDAGGAPGTWTNQRTVTAWAGPVGWDRTAVRVQLQAGYQATPDVGQIGTFTADNVNNTPGGAAATSLAPAVRRPNYGSLLQL